MSKKGTIKNILKFITDVISWTCLCLLILIGSCVIWYIVSAKIYASKGEKYEPYFSLYTIISPSMEPNIKVYDVILDTRVDDIDTIKKGDIITFVSTGSLSSGMTITHRVIEIVETPEGKKFRTKGDNNQSPDGALVLPENVLGKTLLRIPMLGRVQFLLASKGGMFFVILIPAVGIIIYDIIKLLRIKDVNNQVENVMNDKPEEVDEKQKEQEEQRKLELKEKLSSEINTPDVLLHEQPPVESQDIFAQVEQELNIPVVEQPVNPKVEEPLTNIFEPVEDLKVQQPNDNIVDDVALDQMIKSLTSVEQPIDWNIEFDNTEIDDIDSTSVENVNEEYTPVEKTSDLEIEFEDDNDIDSIDLTNSNKISTNDVKENDNNQEIEFEDDDELDDI